MNRLKNNCIQLLVCDKIFVSLQIISKTENIMKRILCLFFCISMVICNAQDKGGLTAKVFMQEISKKSAIEGYSKELSKRYPITVHKGKTYVGIVAKVSPNFSKEEFQKEGIRVNSQIANIVSMRVPISKMYILEAHADILYYDIARKVVPQCDNARYDTRADSVQHGLGLPKAYTGKDVLIGVTDWGFDYTHPNFYDTTYKYSRIYKAWDHFKLSGPAPEGFDYGTEYSTPEQLKNAQCDTSGLYDYGTHGTHVAGIAGGSGAGTQYRGMAPEAQYLFASFLLDEAAALDCFAWMKNQADSVQKRLVINMSWGMYSMGSMDGNSMLSQAIDEYSNQGVTFVSSAGNNGDENFHISKAFNDTIDTLRTIVGFHGSAVGQSVTFWGEPYKSFEAGLGFAVADSVVVRSPFYATNDTRTLIDTFLTIGADTIPYRITKESEDFYSHRPRLVITVMKYSGNYGLHVFATTQNQVLHGWNLVELENHAGNWGSPLSSNRLEGYTNGDPYYGIGEPSCARSCITVAAHNPDRGADRTGPIAPFSSYGPIMGGTYTKPDISGPGMSIASSMNSFTTEEYSPVKTMRFKGRMYSFAKLSGTSMSSPAVAGVVALMLHANPRLTPSQVRDIIIETARIDDKTGDLSDSVSVRWGYGKVDAVAAIEKALEYVSIDNIVETKNVVVYPNPANSRININYNGDEPISVYLYGIDGKCLIQKRNVRELDVQRIPVGIYLLKIKTAEDVITKKIMIAK